MAKKGNSTKKHLGPKTKKIGEGVFNTIFNNISVISWQSALLVEETRVPGEKK